MDTMSKIQKEIKSVFSGAATLVVDGIGRTWCAAGVILPVCREEMAQFLRWFVSLPENEYVRDEGRTDEWIEQELQWRREHGKFSDMYTEWRFEAWQARSEFGASLSVPAEVAELLIDIKNSHGAMLMSCPPQDPWLNNRIDERIRACLDKIKNPNQ